MTNAYNAFVKLHGTNLVTIIAEADLFEAFTAQTPSIYRLSKDIPKPGPTLMYKTAVMYKLAIPGWSCWFLNDTLNRRFNMADSERDLYAKGTDSPTPISIGQAVNEAYDRCKSNQGSSAELPKSYLHPAINLRDECATTAPDVIGIMEAQSPLFQLREGLRAKLRDKEALLEGMAKHRAFLQSEEDRIARAILRLQQLLADLS